MGIDSPLSHSVESHTAWSRNRRVGFAHPNPASSAAIRSFLLSRLAVWLSRVISEAENQVSALQSVPLNRRG